jgi:hypothetical protein
MDIDNEKLKDRIGEDAFKLWTLMVDNRDYDDIQMIDARTVWDLSDSLKLHTTDNKFFSVISSLKAAKLVSPSIHDSDSQWGFVRMVWGWRKDDGSYSVPERTVKWLEENELVKH